jgi:hypothetical protein
MQKEQQYLLYSWQDPLQWLGLLLSLGLVFGLARHWGRRHLQDAQARRGLYLALGLRLGGGLALAALYVVIYGGGDLTGYYFMARVLLIRLWEQPHMWQELLWPDYAAMAAMPRHMPFTDGAYLLWSHPLGRECYFLYHNPAGYWVARLVALLLLPAAGSFWGATVLGSALAFVGSWRLYVLAKQHLQANKLLWALFFMLPGLVFWLSGAGKDALCWLGWATVAVALLTWSPRRWHRGLLWTLGGALLVWLLRSPLFWASLPFWLAILLWQVQQHYRWPRKVLLAAALLGALAVGGLLSQVRYGEFSIIAYAHLIRSYSINTQVVTEKNQALPSGQMVHIIDIGPHDPTLWGTLQKLPIAVITGLYRPLPGTATNLTSLLASMENLLLLGLTAWLLFCVLRHPTRSRKLWWLGAACIAFGVLYAGFLGLTVPFAGSLVRYKVFGTWAFFMGLYLWQAQAKPNHSDGHSGH